MSEEVNIILQWTGVGIALLICIIYVFRKLKRPKTHVGHDTSACEGCPLLDNCSKKACSDHHHSSGSCCH